MDLSYILRKFAIRLTPARQRDQALPLTSLELLEMWLNGFVWSSILVIVLALLVFLGWWTFNRSHPKLISGINYYRFPITVKVGEASYSLDQFEIFAHPTTRIGDVPIEVYNDSGDRIQTLNFSSTRQAAAGVLLLSPETGVKLCPALIDSTEVFYPRPGKIDPQVYLVSQLTPVQSSALATYYEYKGLQPFFKLLVPSTYDGHELPPRLSENQKIYGIYFVECDILSNQNLMTEEVVWWTNYDPQTQKQLYQRRQEDLQNTPEYSL